MERTITVKGVGTASVKPDYIEITLNISEKDSDYGKAVNAANDGIGKLQGAVVSAGFAKEAVKTLNFNVSANYENEMDDKGHYHRIFRGYVCHYRLKLGFDMDTALLSRTIDAVAGCGADAELSIGFTVKNPERVSCELLRSAADNAREKAELLCAASGVKLGELQSIDYDWSEINVHSASCYERGITGTPELQPEDVKARDSATFVWTII